jgi:radical SAM protein with 4Fe4S-binding SPASM domain
MMPAEFDAGDLHEERLEDIWNDAARFGRAERFDAKQLTGACARCQFGSLCRAGCPTMAFYTTGSTSENPYCLLRLEKARLQKAPAKSSFRGALAEDE